MTKHNCLKKGWVPGFPDVRVPWCQQGMVLLSSLSLFFLIFGVPTLTLGVNRYQGQWRQKSRNLFYKHWLYMHLPSSFCSYCCGPVEVARGLQHTRSISIWTMVDISDHSSNFSHPVTRVLSLIVNISLNITWER